MAVTSQTAASESTSAPPKRLQGERVAFVGRMSSMSRRDAVRLAVERGATIVTDGSMLPTMVVIGDDHTNLQAALESEKSAAQHLAAVVARGEAVLWRESEFWQELGLVGSGEDDAPTIEHLYTPAMLAELIGAPVAAVRRWHRQGVLVACHQVRRLPYFDFTEVAIARHLARMLSAGCSLRVIDRKLQELARRLPHLSRPLADPAVVVEGRQLFLRRGEDLTEPGGQLLIDFNTSDVDEDAEESQLLSMVARPVLASEAAGSDAASDATLDELVEQALQWEDQGDLLRAAETYRVVLALGEPSAEANFALADLLYRLGDLSAARERYYVAIELDEEYVEARANLGSVLAENNELELAEAAFEGALSFHPDYADVHYHLANVLDRLDRPEQARDHWRIFLQLAPESPWATLAREQLELGCPEFTTESAAD